MAQLNKEDSPSLLPWGGVTDLGDEVTVAKAILKKAWMREKLWPDVFFRRDRPNDPDGLSVTNPDVCTSEELCATFKSCSGVAHASVGTVRSLGYGLDIVPGPDSNSHVCHHASIINVPYRDEDPQLAEDIGTALASAFKLVWPASGFLPKPS